MKYVVVPLWISYLTKRIRIYVICEQQFQFKMKRIELFSFKYEALYLIVFNPNNDEANPDLFYYKH